MVSCQPNEWKIQVPIGTYSVKITTGDPKMTFGVGLSVNDRLIIEPQMLSKNQYFTNSKEVVVMDGFIRVNSKCEQDCNAFWSRINAIEITKVETASKLTPTSSSIQSLGCGNSFQNGRCLTGPSVEDCVFQQISDFGAEKCTGFMHLIKIPNNYGCVNQRGKYKCIKDSFPTN